mmetsp:Transcript_42225/g.80728  ORF Transcript_42225/g.80728 Transcript_42225/m.80728 type:complete len:105 (-) Transcript_42225:477-791(-)
MYTHGAGGLLAAQWACHRTRHQLVSIRLAHTFVSTRHKCIFSGGIKTHNANFVICTMLIGSLVNRTCSIQLFKYWENIFLKVRSTASTLFSASKRQLCKVQSVV